MNLTLSPIKQFRILADSMDNTVSLGQGTPFFETPKFIKDEVKKCIDEKKVDWYGDPRGLRELRWEVFKLIKKEEDIYYNPEGEIIITPGAMAGLNLVLASLFKKGDEILIPTPTYYPIINIPKVYGLKTTELPSINKIKINKKTKGIIIVNPNNPTGKIYSNRELEYIKKLVLKHNLILIVDEVYKYFTYNRQKADYRELNEIKGNLVRIMSFSKAWSMSGWRVGYMASSDEIIKKVLPVSDLIYTASASLVSQYGALAAIKSGYKTPKKFRQEFKSKRDLMAKYLNKLDCFSYKIPDAGFYYFLKLKKNIDDWEFCMDLLKNIGVAAIPGSAFGKVGKGFIRLSFSVGKEDIKEGMKRMINYLL